MFYAAQILRGGRAICLTVLLVKKGKYLFHFLFEALREHISQEHRAVLHRGLRHVASAVVGVAVKVVDVNDHHRVVW